jgi:hypothetical protein
MTRRTPTPEPARRGAIRSRSAVRRLPRDRARGRRRIRARRNERADRRADRAADSEVSERYRVRQEVTRDRTGKDSMFAMAVDDHTGPQDGPCTAIADRPTGVLSDRRANPARALPLTGGDLSSARRRPGGARFTIHNSRFTKPQWVFDSFLTACSRTGCVP